MQNFEDFLRSHFEANIVQEADDDILNVRNFSIKNDDVDDEESKEPSNDEPLDADKTEDNNNSDKNDEASNGNPNEGDSKNHYFFSNIIFFTNERDSSKNKTLKNLEDAIKDTGINLYVFKYDEVDYKAKDKSIKISDTKTKLTIDEQSNIDTIVIVRLSAQDSEQCVECIKELQEWGLFVINPIQSVKKASNKYTSAVLLEKYNIPQPKFTLLTRNDVKNGQESLDKKLKKIYPDLGEDEKEDKKKEYVIKLLNGHGGTGVFMCNGKTILAILQAMFAVDNELELLLQKKEEADGGDIRVHVLTMRTKQMILAQMKRVKISGDFRSNVSLGAQAEKVELTKEQEEIALKVGKISGMPWCAVDIMPIVKDSNPELGENAVLEYNSSPGTEGISDVIDDNFVKILLDNINDINELTLFPKSIGYIENITFKFNDSDEKLTMAAKLDTGNGAYASTIGCDRLDVTDNEVSATINGKEYKFKKHGSSSPKVGQEKEKRITVIIPEIQIGSRKLLDVEFALVDNRKKSTKVLLNRDVLSKLAYMINPAKKHTIEERIEEKL